MKGDQWDRDLAWERVLGGRKAGDWRGTRRVQKERSWEGK